MMMDELFVFIKYELNVPSKGLYMMEHLSSSSEHSSSLEPEQLSSCRHSAKALNLKSSIKPSVLGPFCTFRNTYQSILITHIFNCFTRYKYYVIIKNAYPPYNFFILIYRKITYLSSKHLYWALNLQFFSLSRLFALRRRHNFVKTASSFALFISY